MREALIEAEKADAIEEIPVGSVITYQNKIIARSHNLVESGNSAIKHAELNAIDQAVKKLAYKHLLDCTIYVTLEPCPMCAGAIVLSRIPRLVFGTNDPKSGAAESVYNITDDYRLNHRCEVVGGILAEQSSTLLKNFFKKLRSKK